jgi:transposase InsO family protein
VAQKNLASTLTRAERLALVDRQAAALPLTEQAELLTLSRRSLYYRAVPPSAEEIAIKHAIDRIYTDQPSYGSRRIAVILERDYGMLVNRKAVQRDMREMGIAGISPGPNLSGRNPEHRIYPYLLRGVTAAYPNHVWSIDITYIRLVRGWMYLVAVLDLYARYVVRWALDDTLELPFVLDAVGRALSTATPRIWNSDQGSHFTSPQYIGLLSAAGVQISMDGRGRALDNIFVERLWRTVKYEDVVRHASRLRHCSTHSSLGTEPAVPSAVPYAVRRQRKAPSKACGQCTRRTRSDGAPVRGRLRCQHQVAPGLGLRAWSTQVNARKRRYVSQAKDADWLAPKGMWWAPGLTSARSWTVFDNLIVDHLHRR